MDDSLTTDEVEWKERSAARPGPVRRQGGDPEAADPQSEVALPPRTSPGGSRNGVQIQTQTQTPDPGPRPGARPISPLVFTFGVITSSSLGSYCIAVGKQENRRLYSKKKTNQPTVKLPYY